MTSPGRPVRFVYRPSGHPAGLRGVRLHDRDDYGIGPFVWQVGTACRRASIDKISLDEPGQRRGLGRRFITRALRDGPDCSQAAAGRPPRPRRSFPP